MDNICSLEKLLSIMNLRRWTLPLRNSPEGLRYFCCPGMYFQSANSCSSNASHPSYEDSCLGFAVGGGVLLTCLGRIFWGLEGGGDSGSLTDLTLISQLWTKRLPQSRASYSFFIQMYLCRNQINKATRCNKTIPLILHAATAQGVGGLVISN